MTSLVITPLLAISPNLVMNLRVVILCNFVIKLRLVISPDLVIIFALIIWHKLVIICRLMMRRSALWSDYKLSLTLQGLTTLGASFRHFRHVKALWEFPTHAFLWTILGQVERDVPLSVYSLYFTNPCGLYQDYSRTSWQLGELRFRLAFLDWGRVIARTTKTCDRLGR